MQNTQLPSTYTYMRVDLNLSFRTALIFIGQDPARICHAELCMLFIPTKLIN